MTQKHTPGPWRLTDIDDELKEGGSFDAIMYKDRVVMHASDASGWAASLNFKSDADRDLILAAPDLLDALEQIVQCEEARRNDIETLLKMPHDLYRFSDERVKKARAAIAKARGG